MLRFLFSETKPLPLTRFTQKPEAKKIIEFLSNLQTKEIELKESSDKLGPGSPDYAKYAVINDLNNKLTALIDSFSSKPTSTNELLEIQSFINLLRELNEHITLTIEAYDTILNTSRNNNLKHAKKAAYLAKLGIYGGAFFLGGPVIGIGTLIAGAYIPEGDTVRASNASTFNLMKDFYTTLESTIKNLILIFELRSPKIKPLGISNTQIMTCPITKDIMDDPYMCFLDGYSYEKSAIIQCLTESRKSPITRKSLPEGATIKNYIVENRALKDIITNYKLKLYAPSQAEVKPSMSA